jgi:hypothetical protein
MLKAESARALAAVPRTRRRQSVKYRRTGTIPDASEHNIESRKDPKIMKRATTFS